MCVCARDSMGVLVGGGVHACVCFYENTPFGAVACYFTSALLQTLSLGYRYPLFSGIEHHLISVGENISEFPLLHSFF